jgi:membrane-associated HD superfamily phosphohydrolase
LAAAVRLARQRQQQAKELTGKIRCLVLSLRQAVVVVAVVIQDSSPAKMAVRAADRVVRVDKQLAVEQETRRRRVRLKERTEERPRLERQITDQAVQAVQQVQALIRPEFRVVTAGRLRQTQLAARQFITQAAAAAVHTTAALKAWAAVRLRLPKKAGQLTA